MLSLDLRNIANASIALSLDKVRFTQESSTYYLAIDKGLMPDVDNTYKVLKNLNLLIAKWISCVKSISKKDNRCIVYLPFDFVDEYLGCLSVELLTDGNLKIDYGYTEEVKGYSHNPSQIECLNTDNIKDYEELSDSFECSQNELLADLEDMNSLINKFLVEIN